MLQASVKDSSHCFVSHHIFIVEYGPARLFYCSDLHPLWPFFACILHVHVHVFFHACSAQLRFCDAVT